MAEKHISEEWWAEKKKLRQFRFKCYRIQSRWSFHFWASHTTEWYLLAISPNKKLSWFEEEQSSFLELLEIPSGQSKLSDSKVDTVLHPALGLIIFYYNFHPLPFTCACHNRSLKSCAIIVVTAIATVAIERTLLIFTLTSKERLIALARCVDCRKAKL